MGCRAVPAVSKGTLHKDHGGDRQPVLQLQLLSTGLQRVKPVLAELDHAAGLQLVLLDVWCCKCLCRP